MINCNNCGSSNYVALSKVTCLYSNELLSVVKCSDCDLVYLNPRPDKSLGLEYFEKAYSNAEGFEEHEYYRNHDQIFRRNKVRFDTIKDLPVNRKRVLDFGAGQGHFVKTAADHGWDAVGIELSVAAIRVAKENFDLNLLDSLDKVEGLFDVITLWDVIEHLEDPKQTLLDLEKYLAPEGYFIIETSNIDSSDYVALKENWSYWNIDHLYYYSRKTLNYLMNTINFRPFNNQLLSSLPKKTGQEKYKKYKAFLLSPKNLMLAFRKKFISFKNKDIEDSSLMVVIYQRKK